jgi:hypothetical protein
MRPVSFHSKWGWVLFFELLVQAFLIGKFSQVFIHFTSREHIPCTLCDLNLFQIITPISQVFSDLHSETHKEWDLRKKGNKVRGREWEMR